MQRKSSRGCIEEEPKVNNDLSKEKVFDFINLCWRIFKLALILVIIFPFIDKIRHKGYITQAINSSTIMTLDASHATQHVIYS